MAAVKPTHVTIGSFEYKIEWPTALDDHDGGEAFGRCWNAQSIIQVCSKYAHQQQADTLVHEILHAIWWVSAMSNGMVRSLAADKDFDLEEQFVAQTASLLTAVLRDNPPVVKFIQARQKPIVSA